MITSRWEQVKSIFGAALELPEADRPAFVAQACGIDTEMHAEILTLLAANQAMGSFMKDPVTKFPIPASFENRNCLQSGEMLCERFEIVRLLGEGGMGRVYEARDLDLGVRLALKTIRPEISSDPRTIELFKHEIQLARQVTHPNVCRIFDLERHKTGASQVTFLTMELLEGETLESRLQRDGAMRAEHALPLIEQMADGLNAIHDMAVIHRDFKPSNVLLVVSGIKIRVVITDFGLARAKALAVVSEFAASSKVMTGLAGTPAYMAPEQLTGGEISPATDIYAFGLVIYKMVTGRLPHDTRSELPILTSRAAEPYLSPQVYSPDLEATWEQGIMRCLEVDPEMRFQSAKQLLKALGAGVDTSHALVRSSNGAIETLPPNPPPAAWWRFSRLRPVLVLTIVVLAISIATTEYLIRRPHESAGTVELTPMTADPGLTWGPTLSADGNTLAYSSDRDGPGNLNIWTQNLTDNSKKQVTHDRSDASTPALAPDGTTVVYRSERDGGGIYVSSVKGGDARLLARLGRDPRFSPDGTRIAFWIGQEHNQDDRFKAGGKAFTIPVQGGSPTPIEPSFADARYPAWSSDGSHIIFQGAPEHKSTFAEASDWWVESENSHKAIPTGAFSILHREGLILYGCSFYWVGDSIIFAARKSFGTNLWVIHLSDNLQATLPVRRITSGTDDDIQPWASAQGKLVLSSTIASSDIWKIPISAGIRARFGAPKRVTASAAVDYLLSVSNDGRKLAFRRRTGQVKQTLLKDMETGQETIIPIPEDAVPVISDDGGRIAYSVTHGNKHPIIAFYIASQISKQLCDDCGTLMALSPDGRRLLYGLEKGGIGMLDTSTEQKSEALTSDGAILEQSRFSPDGKWIAFISTIDEGHSQLRIAPVEGESSSPQDHWIPITGGDTRDLRPTWSADGNSLFFLSNRDGFHCIWQIQIDPITRYPHGTPEPIQHFHYARLSPGYLSIDSMGLGLGGGSLFLNLGEVTGNVFTGDLK